MERRKFAGLLKVCLGFFVLGVASANNSSHEWELAVVANDQIELLLSDGTLIGETVPQFTRLKALTYDAVRHRFVVSDMDSSNDTIFSVRLTKETDIEPVVQDLPDDVQGLAIDPIEDTLYWTDSINKTINFVRLNDTDLTPQTLFTFTDEHPQDVVIDICRRYIYWTNSDVYKPTIERAKLDGSGREVLIDSDLRMPAGISLDYKAQRLYWADMREGIYFRIDSADLTGKNREIVFEGTHTKPFGIAVDEEAVYWTDVNNNALWKYYKNEEHATPEMIREFDERPMGLIAKNVHIRSYPDCVNLEKLIEEVAKTNVDKEEYFEEVSDKRSQPAQCLNGGVLVGTTCKCRRGYVGTTCEQPVCHNFCLHGTCHLSSKGYPTCRCAPGHAGSRCEHDMCSGYCLNDGTCRFQRGDVVPRCTCTTEWGGTRCETGRSFEKVCEQYCESSEGKEDGVVMMSEDGIECRCHEDSYILAPFNSTTVSKLSALEPLAPSNSTISMALLEDHILTMVFAGTSIVLVLVMAAQCIYFRRKRPPRVRKRIIVSKSVTPLTYRPQQSGGAKQQCEITIENCCNMNVCETPCFEPPKLRCFQNNREDKNKLLSDIENGEDLY